ncbi:hypothetical protein C7C56_024735 [Massilia glaciei]|uniref:P/Homo B domain-containing protein n=2 Tax=Massilia glaciei TaxID=1524097 RepID=A0A2U2HDY6_9BURK|nr:hypothetical protein C7C56_024735 [Massilia glaciei]
MADGGRLAHIAVKLDITHSHIGDLKVSLVPPSGIGVPLHDRSGGDGAKLIQTYSSASLPDLAALRGKPMQGTVRLQVSDLATRDVGKLNSWSLDIDLND